MVPACLLQFLSEARQTGLRRFAGRLQVRLDAVTPFRELGESVAGTPALPGKPAFYLILLGTENPDVFGQLAGFPAGGFLENGNLLAQLTEILTNSSDGGSEFGTGVLHLGFQEVLPGFHRREARHNRLAIGNNPFVELLPFLLRDGCPLTKTRKKASQGIPFRSKPAVDFPGVLINGGKFR